MRVLLEQTTIKSGPESAWSVLADFGDVTAWAPYMRKSRLTGRQPNGVGTRRALQHKLGFRFEEQVTSWEEGAGLAFDVLKAPWPMRDVKESWKIIPDGSCCVVTTEVRYGMKLGPLGSLLDWLLVRFIVGREMRAGIRGLKAHLEQTKRTR